MYELEMTDRAARQQFFAEHPEPVVRDTPESMSSTSRLSLLARSEHCVECAVPPCYSTCDLYRPRTDLKCRRFTFGTCRNEELRTWLLTPFRSIFGSYHTSGPRATCAKNVKHATLLALMERYRRKGRASFEIEYRRTARNEPASQVLADPRFDRLPDEGDRGVYQRGLLEEVAPLACLEVRFAQVEVIGQP